MNKDWRKQPRVPEGRPEGGQFATATGIYNSCTPGLKRVYQEFHDPKVINDFFYYDDARRGLLAKLNSSHGKWEKSLTNDEKEAISSYTTDGYEEINDYLRRRNASHRIDRDFVIKEIQNLDAAISRYHLRKDITVRRGVNKNALSQILSAVEVSKIQQLIGKIYKEEAYTSTTVLHGNSVATTKPVVFTIHVPEGKGRGAYINQFSGLNEDVEYEFLIKRGAEFKIKRARYDDELDKTYIEMEMLTDD